MHQFFLLLSLRPLRSLRFHFLQIETGLNHRDTEGTETDKGDHENTKDGKHEIRNVRRVVVTLFSLLFRAFVILFLRALCDLCGADFFRTTIWATKSTKDTKTGRGLQIEN
jgi:hypothetical protein